MWVSLSFERRRRRKQNSRTRGRERERELANGSDGSDPSSFSKASLLFQAAVLFFGFLYFSEYIFPVYMCMDLTEIDNIQRENSEFRGIRKGRRRRRRGTRRSI